MALVLGGRGHHQPRESAAMGRYRFPAFTIATAPRYVVVWDLHWRVLECRRFEPGSDLSAAMAAAIDCLANNGWLAESTPEYGFVFVRRATERRLIMLTPRDPSNSAQQSYSPFRPA
jgi:hypothetical protein